MVKKHLYELRDSVNYTFSARYRLPTELTKAQVMGRLRKAVIDRADPHLPLIGIVVGEGEDTPRSQVVFGLEPSSTWGTPQPEKIGAFVRQVTQKYHWQQVPEVLPAVRVSLGRRMGYDVFKEVSIERTAELFRATGRRAVHMTAGDLFSIRYLPERRPWFYREPGALVDITKDQLEDGALDDVLAVAGQVRQFRVTSSITGASTQLYQLPSGFEWE